MKKQNKPLSDKASLMYLKFFGSGYSPKAPGTVGSLATLPLIYLISITGFGLPILITIILLLTISSCFVADYIQKKYHIHDPGWIVIDEVIGMLITWCFVFPSINIIDLSLVFVLFRAFDIIKIWPATYFDKKILHGSGTIIDDVISGVYAGISVVLVKLYVPLFN